MHAVSGRYRDESLPGKVFAGGAELGEVTSLPTAAVEKDDGRDLGLRGFAGRREVDLQPLRLAAGFFVHEGLTGRGVGLRAVIGRVGTGRGSPSQP